MSAYISDGIAKYNANDFRGALSDFTKAINSEPNHPQLYYIYILRASTHENLNDDNAALADYNRGIVLNTDNISDNAEAYKKRGDVNYRLGNYRAALKDYNQAIKLDPKDINTYLSLAITKQKLNNLNGALETIQAAIEINKNNAELYRACGTLNQLLQHPQAAIDAYSKTINLDRTDAGVYFDRGTIYYHQNQLANAEADLDQAIKLDSNQNKFYAKRAAIMGALNKYEGAIRDLDIVIRSQPTTEHYLARASAHLSLKNYEDAINDCAKSIAISPSVTAYLFSAEAKRLQQQYAAAIADCDAVIQIAPADATPHNIKGTIYADLDKHQDAINAFTKAINLDENDIQSYRKRSQVYFALENYSDAISDCNTVIATQPDTETYITLATAHLCLNHYQNAINACSKAIESDPSNSDYYEIRLTVRKKLNLHADALEDCNALIRLEPTNATHYFERGEIHIELNKYQNAVDDFSHAIQLDNENNVDYYTQRAIANRDLNKFEEALQDITTAVKNKPTSENYILRANIKMRMDNHADAIIDCTQAIDLDPQPTHYLLRGTARLALQHYQETINDLSVAIDANLTNIETYRGRAIAYLLLNQGQQALPDFNMAIELDNTDGKLFMLRGKARFMVNDFPGAITDFEQAALLDPHTRLQTVTQWRRAKEQAVENYFTQGDERKTQRDYREALAFYNKALAINAHNIPCHIQRISTKILIKQTDELINDVNNLITWRPNHQQSHQIYGDVQYFLKNYNAALDSYNKAIATLNTQQQDTMQIHEIATYVSRGATLKQLNEPTAANSDFQHAITLTATTGEQHFYQAIANMRLQNFGAALASLEQAKEQQYFDAPLFDLETLSGKIKLQLEDYNGALNDLTATITRDKDNARAYKYRARTHLRLDNPIAALTDYQIAQQLNIEYTTKLKQEFTTTKPAAADKHFEQGNNSAAQQQHQAAIDSYNKAIALNPLQAIYYLKRAEAHTHISKTKEAINDYTQGIQIINKSPTTYHISTDEFAAAKNGLKELHNIENQRIADLKKRLAQEHHAAGNKLLTKKNYPAALEKYNEALRNDPNNPTILSARSHSFVTVKQPIQALEAYEAIAANTQTPDQMLQSIIFDLKQQVAAIYLNQGIEAYRQNKHKEAIELFRKGIQRNPKNAELFIYLGKTEQKLKQHACAQENFNAAIQLQPKNADLFICRGQTLEAQQIYHKALEDYVKAINLNSKDHETLRTNITKIRKPAIRCYMQEHNYSAAIMHCDAILRSDHDSQYAHGILQHIDQDRDAAPTLPVLSQLLLKKYVGILSALKQLLLPFNIPLTMKYLSQQDCILIQANDILYLDALKRYFNIHMQINTNPTNKKDTIAISLANLNVEDCEELLMTISTTPREDFLLAIAKYLTATNIELTPATTSAKKLLSFAEDQETSHQLANTYNSLKNISVPLYQAAAEYRQAYINYTDKLNELWLASISSRRQLEITKSNTSNTNQIHLNNLNKKVTEKSNQCKQAATRLSEANKQLRDTYLKLSEHKVTTFKQIFQLEENKLNSAYDAINRAENILNRCKKTADKTSRSGAPTSEIKRAQKTLDNQKKNLLAAEQKLQNLWNERERGHRIAQTQHWGFIQKLDIDYLWFKQQVFDPSLRYITDFTISKQRTNKASFQMPNNSTIETCAHTIFTKLKDANVFQRKYFNNQHEADYSLQKELQKYAVTFLQSCIVIIIKDQIHINLLYNEHELLACPNQTFMNSLETGKITYNGDDDWQPPDCNHNINDTWWQRDLSNKPTEINWFAANAIPNKLIITGADLLPFLLINTPLNILPSTTLIWEMNQDKSEDNEQQANPTAPPLSSSSSTKSSLRNFSAFFQSSPAPIIAGSFTSTLSDLSGQFKPSAPPQSDISTNSSLSQFRHSFLGANLP